MNEELKLASDFQPYEGEANFGPTITKEVVGGMHIAPECVLVRGGRFLMIEWPNGLPRHDDGPTVRFPHGLMQFGETLETTAERLVKAQAGFQIDTASVAYVYSYMDDMNHWHIEPLLVCLVKGEPDLPENAGGIVEFRGSKLPDGAVWGQDAFSDAYERFLKPFIA